MDTELQQKPDFEANPGPAPDSGPAEAPPPAPVAGWRWAIHLVILGAYPPALGLLGMMGLDEKSGPILTPEVGPLLMLAGGELFIFGVIFGLASLASRVRPDQLYLRRQSLWSLTWRGVVYSIGLRGVLMVFIIIVAAFMVAVQGQSDGMAGLAPQIDVLVDGEDLAENPGFLIVNMTVISFLVAGLREELWRAGMLAAFAALMPVFYKDWKGKTLAVLVSAVIFGLGHLPQGWGGVIMTALLGIGLGLIMVVRRSTWEAVAAHGFFNASTFLFLYVLAKYFPHLLQGAGGAGQ